MKRELVILIWIVLVILLLGRLLSYRMYSPIEPSLDGMNIVGVVREDGKEGSTVSYILLGDLRLVLKGQSQFERGDVVLVSGSTSCTTHKFEEPYRCSRADIEPSQVRKIGFDEKERLYIFMDELRLYLQSIIAKSFSLRQSQLLSGILLGSQDLPSSFKGQLANVGLSHVVAASGMNVTLVAGLVFGLFKSVPGNKRFKVSIGICLIFFYGGITGFDPPIVRACLMSACLFIAPLLGRQSSSFITLFVAAYLMLWVEPGLLEDFGFLLSFTSMIGQIALITLDIKVTNIFGLVTEVLGQTIAAILATLPIVLIGFSKFSLISIATNVLVVWTIEPLMLLGGLVLLLGVVSQELAYLASLPVYPLLDYFLWVVEFFDRPEFVWNIEMNFVSGAGYYLLLTAVYFLLRSWLRKRRLVNTI